MADQGSIKIRRLGESDLALLRDINILFGEVFGERETYIQSPPGDAYLERLLGNPGFIALAARRDGELVGALAAYEFVKFEQQRSEIYVYDLAVVEVHRRRGVATALIEAVKPIAKEMGAWTIMIQADAADEPAVQLYRKLGRGEDVLHFDIDPGS